MALLARFDPPAFQKDFPNDPQHQEALATLWSANVNRWANAALIGDVWDLVNYGPRPAFYNPLVTDTPASATIAPVTWHAFPGRLNAYFPGNPKIYEWADTGQIPPIAFDLCLQQSMPSTPYGPAGPRGWQDEYCEWSVTRDASNKIVSIMFTCENPEYWLTLWQVDPNGVLAVYRQLVSPAIQLADLALLDANGNPVIDPSTGRPAYNPLNRWNSGTQTLPNSGGAVHLTSRPNTLGAEFDLAAAATIPRVNNGQSVTSASALVCCALYGQIGRQSDPTIGQNVNFIVNNAGLQGARATLTNPPGLYMQIPDFSGFVTPDGTPASQFWKVVRGQLKDPNSPNDIDRILHATFSVPPARGYTVSDIKIGTTPIQYGSQVAAVIGMALSATAYAGGGANQPGVACTANSSTPYWAVSFLQDANVFAEYRAVEAAANELPLSIPILSLAVPRGSTVSNVALGLNLSGDAPQNATFSVDGGGVTITVTGATTIGGVSVLLVKITVDADAALGDRSILVTVPGQPASTQPVIGLLNIVSQARAQAAPITQLALGKPISPRIKPHFLAGRR